MFYTDVLFAVVVQLIGCIYYKIIRVCLSFHKGHKLKETLLPSLNLLTESGRIHRETRKFLRSKVSTGLRQIKSIMKRLSMSTVDVF